MAYQTQNTTAPMAMTLQCIAGNASCLGTLQTGKFNAWPVHNHVSKWAL